MKTRRRASVMKGPRVGEEFAAEVRDLTSSGAVTIGVG